MVALDVLTFNCFSYFSCNVLFEVDIILWFRRFASHCLSSLLFCLVASCTTHMNSEVVVVANAGIVSFRCVSDAGAGVAIICIAHM